MRNQFRIRCVLQNIQSYSIRLQGSRSRATIPRRMIKISSAYLFVLYHKTSLIDVAYLITKGSEDEPDKILRYINGIRNCALKKVIKPVLSNLHAHVLTEKVWDGPPIEVHAEKRAKWKGGVLYSDGNIYCARYNMDNILIIKTKTTKIDVHFCQSYFSPRPTMSTFTIFFVTLTITPTLSLNFSTLYRYIDTFLIGWRVFTIKRK